MQVSGFKARTLVLTIVAVLAVSIMAPLASYAGSEGNRNTAIGLAGVAAYLFSQGETVPGIAAALGAGIAYNRYQDAREDERYRDSRYRDHRWDRYRDHRDWRHTDTRWGKYNNRGHDWDRYNDNRRDRDRDDRYDRDNSRRPNHTGYRR